MQEIRKRPLESLVRIATIVFLILNIWLASKLNPLEQNISANAHNIEAIRQDTQEIIDQHGDFVTEGELDGIVIQRLDRIESKLDRLIER